MEKYALIVAGGRGKRMGNQIPKQFLPLHGKAILLHTLERFIQAIPEIKFVLVLPEDQIDLWKEMARQTDFEGISIALGGAERSDSVKSGLSLVADGTLVAIHDAVRPLVTQETIVNCFQQAEAFGNAIPFAPLTNSLRKLQGDSSKAVDRADYVSVQTPQCFRSELIKKAYQDLDGKFTDDASVLESAGEQINLVKGNLENIKITNPIDLKLAEQLLKL